MTTPEIISTLDAAIAERAEVALELARGVLWFCTPVRIDGPVVLVVERGSRPRDRDLKAVLLDDVTSVRRAST